MSTILVVDDERTTLKVIQNALQSNGYEVHIFASPDDALQAFRENDFDMVVSDYYMPGMGGAEFLQAIRTLDAEIPFIFLTGNSDLQIAIELVKSGANDYLVKPIVVEELVFRVGRCMEESERRLTLERIEKERELIALENEKLVNWRQLYANKDIRQTEQMIRQLSQAVNQAGGYLWLDLLKGELQEPKEGVYALSSDVAQMVLEAAEQQKNIFDYITFIADIDRIDLQVAEHQVPALLHEIVAFCREEIDGRFASYEHRLSVGVPSVVPEGIISIDKMYLKRIMRELLANAVKFSPPGSRIVLGMDIQTTARGTRLEITVQNHAKPASARDTHGHPIVGIPYDYSEMVFDLFYTIEQFPIEIPEEEWRSGTGLYVCRKLLKRQGAWIRAAGGTDHTGDSPIPVVRVTITLPVQE
ncbi:MAG: response regulator [Spirochaetaceae bacterium]|nr:MAG: response regulator [Spirochaetaceae bacterium]